MSLLDFRHVDAGYGPYRALNDLSLTIHDAEAVAVLGRNGAGKSTLARVASGLVRVSAGTARVLGFDVAKATTAQLARVGVVHLPEGTGLFRSLTIEENVRLRVGGSSRSERRARMTAAFEQLGDLDQRRRALGSELSGGQQRRVAVAAALASRPRLLIADEPALGLSPVATAAVYDDLRRARDLGCGLVIIETRLTHVAELCPRAVVLERGSVLYDGETAGSYAALDEIYSGRTL